MKVFVRTIIGVFALLLVSCAADVANRYYSAERYAPRNPKDVEILSRPPGRHYEVIADLQALNQTPGGMQKQAARIGADAVIITALGGFYNPNDQWAGSDSMSSSYSHLVGTAIKYKP